MFVNNLKYLLVGTVFGIVFVKSQVISWFRIQEMFHLHAFHMFGVIGTAVGVGALSIFLLKRFEMKTFSGEKINFTGKPFNKGTIIGSLIFGIGWAMTGACPGPLYANLSSGFAVLGVTLLSAIVGTWVYGLLQDKLPH